MATAEERTRKDAERLAKKGRYGDTHLLHINDDELQSLLDTGFITFNPDTGLPEAFGNPFSSFSNFVKDVADPLSILPKPTSPAGKALETLGGPGSPETLLQAADYNRWGTPLSSTKNSWDIIGGGTTPAPGGGLLVDNPTLRNIGRLIGLGIGGGAAAGALSGSGSAATGASAADTSAADASSGTAGISGTSGVSALTGSGGSDTLATGDALDQIANAGAGGASQGADIAAGANASGAYGSSLDAIANASAGGASQATGGSAAAGGSPGVVGGALNWLKGAATSKYALPLAALTASALTTPKTVPAQGQASDIAAQELAGAQPALSAASSLTPALATGQLPPGADSVVNQAEQDAVNTIKAKYASLGLSGSTMETQEIAAAKDRATAQRFNLATQMTQTGLQASGIAAGMEANAAQIYQNIMNVQLQQDQALSGALANFASAAALGAAVSKA